MAQGKVMSNKLTPSDTSETLVETMLRMMQQFRADFPLVETQQQLQTLTNIACDMIDQTAAPDRRLAQLIDLFYHQWGFAGASGKYQLSELLWLDQVLTKRRGSSVTLGAIFLHIAARLELWLQPVIFPTQLILLNEKIVDYRAFLNPFSGELLSDSTLQRWIIGTLGIESRLQVKDLQPASAKEVITRLLETLKAALMEEQKMEVALRVSQYLLSLKPDDPYEIRDRGLIYAQLNCEHIAIDDLNYFIEQCPEDPISELIKIQLQTLTQQSIILH